MQQVGCISLWKLYISHLKRAISRYKGVTRLQIQCWINPRILNYSCIKRHKRGIRFFAVTADDPAIAGTFHIFSERSIIPNHKRPLIYLVSFVIDCVIGTGLKWLSLPSVRVWAWWTPFLIIVVSTQVYKKGMAKGVLLRSGMGDKYEIHTGNKKGLASLLNFCIYR